MQRGREAEREGDLAAAAEWWRQASLLDPESGALRRLRRRAREVERFGDRAVEARRYRDAFLSYGALLHLEPDVPELIRKNDAAHAALGEELHANAIALEARGLEGAAFATELQALHHAPLHPDAFTAAARLKAELLTRNHVAVQGIEIEDGGAWGFAEALVPRLEVRLREQPPLGPTRAKPWIAGRVRVSVERFEWWDDTRFGIERKKMDPAALALVDMSVEEVEEGALLAVEDVERDLVANPEHEARAFLVSETEAELERLHALLRGPEPTPKPKRGATPVRTPFPPRPPAPEAAEKLEADLEARRDGLGRVPVNLDRGKARARWILPWRETTRTADARVRFELHEIAAPEPDVVTLTLSASALDRTHPGNATHDVDPDPFELPELAALEEKLADAFVARVDVLGKARERRAARLLAQARESLETGDIDGALDAFVDVLFLVGPDKLPDDAAAVIAHRLEHDRFRNVLAGPP